MGIVLLELPHTGQSAQCAGRFITVQNTKVRNSQRELSVAPLAVAEEHEMARAVHGLESPFPLLHVEFEHIILVMRPVTRSFPDADVVHVGSLNFLVAALAVLSP